MTNIPEDSMLRRHYLTEWRNNLDKQLLNGLCNQEKFMNETKPTIKSETITYAPPFWSNGVLIPLIAFAFFIMVIFV